MPEASAKTIVITGASSGIGKATARLFFDKGWNVVATMRHPEAETELKDSPRLKLLALDVQEPESAKRAVTEAIKAFGRIDVWLNNAGYGAFGPLEAGAHEQIVRQFQVNVFGLIACVQAVAPHFRERKAGVLPGESPSLRLLTDYVRLVSRTKTPEPSAFGHAIATHILDLIALSVGADRDAEAAAAERGVRAARLQAIKADISSRLSDGDLSVSAVAARHGVTPRYVHKLFETEGATFSEFVTARRLQLAHRLLTDPRFGSRSITSIAFDAGFSDLSHFNRAFRRRYDVTPTGAKAEASRSKTR